MKSQISGVIITQIPTIPDERGMVIKVPAPYFQVKDVYVTTVRHGAIKAWHGYDTKMLCWSVMSGLVKLVLVDQRPTSETFNVIDEIYIGEGNMASVYVPPGVFNGFKGISQADAYVLVQASEPYHQITRLPVNYFPYDWTIKNG